MIYYDTPRPVRFMGLTRLSAHMGSDLVGEGGTRELDEFAAKIGLKAKWRQNSGTPTEHYDLFDAALDRARKHGAMCISPREFVARVVKPKRALADITRHKLNDYERHLLDPFIKKFFHHTSLGKRLDLLNPSPKDMNLGEIALSMSNQCRYNGCVSRFYSVAEHSVLMSWWAKDEGYDETTRIAMMMHDAHEAYTGDITKSVQDVLFMGNPHARADFEALKDRIDAAIKELIGFRYDTKSVVVVEADQRILLDERRVLLAPGDPPIVWGVDEEGYAPLGVKIRNWNPEEAFSHFTTELMLLGVIKETP
ncbi:MAG: DUF4031 domain-containing protein [Hyphomicrobium sp.]|nr:DUF4031 domain-containing protein [Hyphomicrobium sp.]